MPTPGGSEPACGPRTRDGFITYMLRERGIVTNMKSIEDGVGSRETQYVVPAEVPHASVLKNLYG